MKIKSILIILLSVFILSSCSPKDNTGGKYMPAAVDYSTALEINSPEGLAQASTRLYQDMVNGELDIDVGIETLITYTSASSAELLEQNKTEFASQIKQTQQLLTMRNDAIVDYEFALTEHRSDTERAIKRIQIHQNGKKYYFEQTFILEDGVWKINSDNLIDDFQIKKKFLFWYF